MSLIEEALSKGQRAFSEHQSKELLKSYGILVTREELTGTQAEAVQASKRIGFPVVLKGCSPELTHKTERRLIELNLKDEEEVASAYQRIVDRAKGSIDGVLVEEMVKGDRELVIGLTRDPQFGPCVMFGLGGIFTEVLKDVSFRVAPLARRDAMEMVSEIKGYPILGAFRGQKPVNVDLLCKSLIAVGKIGLDFDKIKEIDINPLIVAGTRPIAVDALVVLE